MNQWREGLAAACTNLGMSRARRGPLQRRKPKESVVTAQQICKNPSRRYDKASSRRRLRRQHEALGKQQQKAMERC